MPNNDNGVDIVFLFLFIIVVISLFAATPTLKINLDEKCKELERRILILETRLDLQKTPVEKE